MTKTNKITAGQLFCMLFISRMVVNVTYSPYTVSYTHLTLPTTPYV